MSLMIEAGVARQALVADSAARTEIILHAIGDCVLGKVLVGRSESGVCAVLLGADRDELEADLGIRFPKARIVASGADIDDDLREVIRFVDEPSRGIRLPLDMRGTPFQRRVWEKVRAIPCGTTLTYTELARWVGPMVSARAVAGACARNPIALAIPCHRVVRSNGDLAGYRWGVERKRALIGREAQA